MSFNPATGQFHSARLNQIADLLRDGKRPIEIRSALNIENSSQITYVRSKIGLPEFSRGIVLGLKCPPSEMKRISVEMKEDGYSYRQIGEHFGVSRERIAKLLRHTPKSKSDACSKCGVAGVRISYHHTSYKQDLAVPLCDSCHRREHTAIFKTHDIA